jgi:hypothetical protein
MAVKFGGIILSTMLGLIVLSSGAIAQQKTVKACQDEWRANKATNQANGVTERSYVDQCRGRAAPIQPAAVPSQPAPAAPAQSPAPTPQPGPSTVAPSPARPAPSAQTAPAGVNQFAVESEAKARCPSDTVVWVNLPSKIYHFSGNRNYGNTKRGAYMCEADTASIGARAAKNEQHP